MRDQGCRESGLQTTNSSEEVGKGCLAREAGCRVGDNFFFLRNLSFKKAPTTKPYVYSIPGPGEDRPGKQLSVEMELKEPLMC